MVTLMKLLLTTVLLLHNSTKIMKVVTRSSVKSFSCYSIIEDQEILLFFQKCEVEMGREVN